MVRDEKGMGAKLAMIYNNGRKSGWRYFATYVSFILPAQCHCKQIDTSRHNIFPHQTRNLEHLACSLSRALHPREDLSAHRHITAIMSPCVPDRVSDKLVEYGLPQRMMGGCDTPTMAGKAATGPPGEDD